MTVRVSDWDNTYDIPFELQTQFQDDEISNWKEKEWTEEWFKKCKDFDEKWGEYQI